MCNRQYPSFDGILQSRILNNQKREKRNNLRTRTNRCRLLAGLLTVAVLMTGISGWAVADAAMVWGDVDGADGVTAADALLALRAATKKITLS